MKLPKLSDYINQEEKVKYTENEVSDILNKECPLCPLCKQEIVYKVIDGKVNAITTIDHSNSCGEFIFSMDSVTKEAMTFGYPLGALNIIIKQYYDSRHNIPAIQPS